MFMDFSKVKWLKNIKPEKGWAYQSKTDIQMPEAKIFQLHWRLKSDPSLNAPQKGDLMALVQNARLTHVVEVLDENVYGNDDDWAAYRVYKQFGYLLQILTGLRYPIKKRFLELNIYLQMVLLIV